MLALLTLLEVNASPCHGFCCGSWQRQSWYDVQAHNCGRRLEGDILANEELCGAVNEQFGDEYMLPFVLNVMRSAPNAPKIIELAENMSEWCHEKALGIQLQNEQRRLGDSEFDEADAYWQSVLKVLDMRRLSGFQGNQIDWAAGEDAEDFKALLETHSETWTSTMFTQCSGYAAALAKIVEETSDGSAADVFAVNSMGSSEEQMSGCGTVVNRVNDAIADGVVEGLSIEQDKNNFNVVVVADGSTLAAQLAALLTGVTLASGAVALKLVEVCEYYA